MKKKLKIDFVVPWVDSTDPEWQASFKEHAIGAGLYTDTTEKRYRDWGLFKYWFRGVEKYAPWVNTIHLITCGHLPDWLNYKHPKLNVVKHEDYIDLKYLPTFSANPIEINIHNIKGLSEHFVYFNDDIFIKAPLKQIWFFKNGTPCDAGVFTALSGRGFNRMIMNSSSIINNHFHKNETLYDHPLKWFNIKYSYNALRTILLLPWEAFTGFYDYHMPNSYLKSTFQEVWRAEKSYLLNTNERKFRHDLDISQAVFRYWQLAQNNFHPIAKHKLGDFCRVGEVDVDEIVKKILSNKKPIICLNDHDPSNLDETIDRLEQAFEKKLPDKSSFEL